MANCPGGTDELLEDCGKYLPPTVDSGITCTKPNIGNNITIETHPTRCNGIRECASHEDEEGCPETTKITMLVLFACMVVFSVVSSVVIGLTKLEQPGDLPPLDTLGERHLIDLATIHQNSDEGRTVCEVLYQRVLLSCQGNHAETISKLKVKFIALESAFNIFLK